MKFNSIQVKIISLIIIALVFIISISITISLKRHIDDLLSSKKTTLLVTTDILTTVVKSIMMSGEAPVAVNTTSNLQSISDFKEIAIYRTDKTLAFNDFQTLEFVNGFQDEIMFEKTGRVDKKIINEDHFEKVLKTNLPQINELKDVREMEYFFPIRNERKCHQCHGDGQTMEYGHIRGIAHFTISIADVYQRINESRKILIALYLFMGIALAVILIIFVRKIIINPLLKIGSTVKLFGQGNLDIKVNLYKNDELGELADKINEMFVGIKERFHLSKYVSKSTNEMIRKGMKSNKGEHKTITVLFSDIRGFTSYSENHSPQDVIVNLNRILQIQANVVEKYNGDIDKFVGDELMAVFENEYDAIKCAYEMIVNVNKINNQYDTNLFIGIGINTGDVIAGNIGSENRREYAVIGDTVNLASRLCSLAKQNMILISENTYTTIKNKINAKAITGQKIKGKTGAVNFYVVESIND